MFFSLFMNFLGSETFVPFLIWMLSLFDFDELSRKVSFNNRIEHTELQRRLFPHFFCFFFEFLDEYCQYY